MSQLQIKKPKNPNNPFSEGGSVQVSIPSITDVMQGLGKEVEKQKKWLIRIEPSGDSCTC